MLRGFGQQVGAALALLPQGRALARSLAGQQQGACAGLAEDAGEHRGAGQGLHHGRFDLVGVEHQVVHRDAVHGFGQAHHDAVVAPQHLRAGAEPFGHAGLDRHAPRRVHARAERREDAHPPVADLVAEPLHHDGAVVGDGAGQLLLFVKVVDQVVGGPGVEADVFAQPGDRAGPLRAAQLPGEGADRAAQLDGASGLVAVPERHLAGFAGGGGDHHAVAGDVLDPPARGTQEEDLARARFEHHLLVELAHARAVGQEHPEQPAVGDRAAARDREASRALAGAHDVGGPVPHQAWPELGEPVAGVAPREQVQHRDEHVLRQVGEVGGTPHGRVQLVHAPLVDRAHGDHLLRQHVEGVPRVARLLDRAGQHALGHHARLEQVAAELREDLAAAGFAHLMARAADALQPARHRPRRFDLHDEVDRAHVDAELQAAGGHDRPQAPGLQRVLDLEPLLARDRPVVRAHQVFVGELVELGREALGQAAPVHEHDRRTMRADQLQQARVDRRPDRGPGWARAGGRTARRHVRGLADLAHVLDRDDDLELHGLAMTRVDDRDGPGPPLGPEPAQEPRDLIERTLRGGQADALGRLLGELVQPFERQREVRAALGGRQGVDLVDDHPPDAAQGLASL